MVADKEKYRDIIDLPHHISERHPQLGRDSYAAQFSPFAALSGYDGVIAETSRTTEEKIELDDDAKTRLSEKLAIIIRHIKDRPEITVLFFVPDKTKDGGEYVTVTGKLKKYEEVEQIILLTDGTAIALNDIYDIRGEIINRYLTDEI